MLWSSPMYQGTVSGALKNALDWLHLLGTREPPFLHDTVIGLFSAAGRNAGPACDQHDGVRHPSAAGLGCSLRRSSRGCSACLRPSRSRPGRSRGHSYGLSAARLCVLPNGTPPTAHCIARPSASKRPNASPRPRSTARHEKSEASERARARRAALAFRRTLAPRSPAFFGSRMSVRGSGENASDRIPR